MRVRNSSAIAILSLVSACQSPRNNLEERVVSLERQSYADTLDKSGGTQAFIKIAESSFVMTRADFGNVAVSIENVADYASGSKVTLNLGNTTSASIGGLTAKLTWGKLDSKGFPVDLKKTKNESFTESLPAGSWKRYEVILPNTSAKEVEFLIVSDFKSSTIELSQR